jgi:hypothetical protein
MLTTFCPSGCQAFRSSTTSICRRWLCLATVMATFCHKRLKLAELLPISTAMAADARRLSDPTILIKGKENGTSSKHQRFIVDCSEKSRCEQGIS